MSGMVTRTISNKALAYSTATSGPTCNSSKAKPISEQERLVEFSATLPLGFRTTPSNLNLRNGGHPNLISNTKFTMLTWLPLSLFFQFQRIANVYFLFVVIIVCMGSGTAAPWDFSPKRWHSKVVPFAGVLLWTAFKDLYEDIRRRLDDMTENMRQTVRLERRGSTGEWASVPWKDVLCGDLLFIECDTAFPADLLILRVAGGHEAFISTANLDGETNLKERSAPSHFRNCHIDGPAGLTAATRIRKSRTSIDLAEQALAGSEALIFAQNLLHGEFEVRMAAPEASLADVRATFTLEDEQFPGDDGSFLPRGCVLRNTPWVVAVAIYVGDETKTRLNSVAKSQKTSSLQRYLNMCVRGMLVTMFFVFVFCATMSVTFYPGSYSEFGGLVHWLIKWLTFCITFYHCVPISLYVAFEMFKLMLGYLITVDKQMFYPSRSDASVEEGAQARTCDLVEEMGQIDFLFSDKTGTLTANEMVFAGCSVDDEDFGDLRPGTGGLRRIQEVFRDQKHVRYASLERFFICMAVCHGCQVESIDAPPREIPHAEDGGQTVKQAPESGYHYSGMSPDEVCLVQAAADVGVTFVERVRSTQSELRIRGPGEDEHRAFTLLYELEFNSDRKRMSVVVEDKDGVVWCITKGADSTTIPLLTTPLSKASLNHLSGFCCSGLRTLIMACKKVDKEYFDRWRVSMDSARSSVDSSRAQRIEHASEEMEKNLEFLGITAVEDRLQDGVPETIDCLKHAGIRVWVLTGDKTETAVDIANSCNLFQDTTTLSYCTNCKNEHEAISKLMEAKTVFDHASDGGLVLDGMSVGFILQSQEACLLVYELGLASRSCICCRLSPMQKRNLVELVRRANPSAITLAIGDGANDVPMIDGAHLGVGIRGKEGSQAVQSGDIAISQFRFLRPLLLCHGRRAYRRVAEFLCYYLYKNVALATPDLIWAFQSKFGGNIAFPEYLSMCYNLFLTSIHMLSVLAFDTDVSDAVSNAFPELYRVGPQRALFNRAIFSSWMCFAVWHGTVVWLVPNLWFGGTNYSKTEPSTFWLASVVSFFLLVVVVVSRLLIFAQSFDFKTTILPCVCAVLSFFPLVAILGYTFVGAKLQPNLHKLPFQMFTQTEPLLALVITPVLALAPDALLRFGSYTFRRTELQRVRAMENPLERQKTGWVSVVAT
eukprot:TRINITY_DN26792_c0_g1_i1.p1 TRINITY_DN26792_c0_g1~~TRINITY_DN26792_c0_g1_i1.p1  ORF type:complete len:1166 (-),score=151.12 TRINITY_DN26792_c0_g1_i1:242-3739(-)